MESRKNARTAPNHSPNLRKRYSCTDGGKSGKTSPLDVNGIHELYRSKYKISVKKHIRARHSTEKTNVDKLVPQQNGDKQPAKSNAYEPDSCTDCGKSYKNRGPLRNHLRLRCCQVPTFGCPHCKYRSKYSCNLYVHIRRKHPTENVTASKLTSSKNIGELLQNPSFVRNVYGRYRCALYGKSSKEKEHLKDHLRLKSGQELACGCPYCEYRTKYSSTVHAHIRRAHPTEKIFVNKLTLSKNIEESLENPPYVRNTYDSYNCTNCGKTYKEKKNLIPHLRLKCGQKYKFGCPYCVFCSNYTSNIHAHIRRNHPAKKAFVNKLTYSKDTDEPRPTPLYARNIDERYGCSNCGKSFKKKGRLSRHRRLHCGQDHSASGCPYCEYRSKFPLGVRTHIGLMHPLKRIRVNKLSIVERHIPAGRSAKEICVEELAPEQNTGERPASPCASNEGLYSCADCGRSYAQKTTLHQHLVYECGKGPRFGCPYCDHRSKYMYNLKTHIKRIHPSKKIVVNKVVPSEIVDELSRDSPYVRNAYERYTCATCGKFYKEKKNLNQHLRFYCGQEYTFDCPYCECRFKYKSSMTKHIRARHSTEKICVDELAPKENVNEQPAITCILYARELYSCADCDKFFENKGLLKNHLRLKCGQEGPKFGYPHCQYRSDYSNNVRRRHSAKKIFVNKLRLSRNVDELPQNPRYLKNNYERYYCANCTRSFAWKVNLINHLRSECSVELRFECPHCDYRSGKRCIVKKHILDKHPAMEVYLVNLPPWESAGKLAEKHDALTHSIYERFGCLDCDKSFVLRRDLRNHQRTRCGLVLGFNCGGNIALSQNVD